VDIDTIDAFNVLPMIVENTIVPADILEPTNVDIVSVLPCIVEKENVPPLILEP
jgi:hypothetical protein